MHVYKKERDLLYGNSKAKSYIITEVEQLVFPRRFVDICRRDCIGSEEIRENRNTINIMEVIQRHEMECRALVDGTENCHIVTLNLAYKTIGYRPVGRP